MLRLKCWCIFKGDNLSTPRPDKKLNVQLACLSDSIPNSQWEKFWTGQWSMQNTAYLAVPWCKLMFSWPRIGFEEFLIHSIAWEGQNDFSFLQKCPDFQTFFVSLSGKKLKKWKSATKSRRESGTNSRATWRSSWRPRNSNSQTCRTQCWSSNKQLSLDLFVCFIA